MYTVYKKYAARGLLNCMRRSCCSATSSRADDPGLNRNAKPSSKPVMCTRTNFEKEAKEELEQAAEGQWQRGLDFSID